MIEILPDYPGNVVAAGVSRQVSGEELHDILLPAVRRCREEHGAVRLLYYFTTEFRRFTSTAAWDDETIGLQHLDAFERVGIVSDVPWLARLAESLAASRPDAVRYFAIRDVTLATQWICSD